MAKTITRRWWNGAAMIDGKNVLPVRAAASAGGSWWSRAGPSSSRTGFSPRKAAKSVPTGGRPAIRSAAAGGTWCASSPARSAAGSPAASPAMSTEKNSPIESTIPAFWKVARMPEAAPRSQGSTLDMIEAVLGELNRPEPTPFRKMTTAKTG